MSYFILYHSPSMRKAACFDGNNALIQKQTMQSVSTIGFPPNTHKVVYYDTAPNHCPYIWSKNFFATTCKVNNKTTNLSINIGDIIFYCTEYISNNPFNELLCDLVFDVKDIDKWPDGNLWDINNRKVQAASGYINKSNKQALVEHFFPSAPTHPWPTSLKYKRKTYIADPEYSFQAQYSNHLLVDILPTINAHLLNNSSYLMDLNFIKNNSKKIGYYRSNNFRGFGRGGQFCLKNRLKFGLRQIPIFQLESTLGYKILAQLSNQSIRINGDIAEELKKKNSNHCLI